MDRDGSVVDIHLGPRAIPQLLPLSEAIQRFVLVPEAVLVASARLAIDADVFHFHRADGCCGLGVHLLERHCLAGLWINHLAWVGIRNRHELMHRFVRPGIGVLQVERRALGNGALNL
jgi:hypothetical protein